MAAQADKRKQAAEHPIPATGALVTKLMSTLVATVFTGPAGAVAGGIAILGDPLQKQMEAAVHNLRLEDNRRRILNKLKQQARDEGCTLNLDELDAQAQITMAAGFDFDSLMDNYERLENLPVLWNAKRETPLERDNGERDKYHDLLVVENVRAFVPLLLKMPELQEWLVVYVSRKESARQNMFAKMETQTQNKPDPYAEFEPKYRAAVVKELDWVELFIERPDVEHESTRQTLSVAYVTLTLARGRYDEAGGGDVSAERLLDTLPADAPRALIVGPAGCGKTTLMRWAAIEAARGANVPERKDRPGERREKMLPQRADGIGVARQSSVLRAVARLSNGQFSQCGRTAPAWRNETNAADRVGGKRSQAGARAGAAGWLG